MIESASSNFYVHNFLHVAIPNKQLMNRSVKISIPDKKFSEWSNQNHLDSFNILCKIIDIWKKNLVTTQYLMYAAINSKSSFFSWEILPYQTCRTFIGRIVQQIEVLRKIVFGGKTLSPHQLHSQVSYYQSQFKKSIASHDLAPQTSQGKDPFCNPSIIEKQRVLAGKKIDVLFNHAPIGFGGEKLHFLFVPKAHKVGIHDLEREEYCEMMELANKVMQYFYKNRKAIENIHLILKHGKDAGQTVEHVHLQMIISSKRSQDFWGKMTVFKNILFGSSPMKLEALQAKVTALKKELTTIR